MVHFKDMNPVDFEFIPPPEAPVFEPTIEEFKDPLAYIAKIRPIAEKTGICKIKPPPDWQPGFAVDTNNFRFTPRMQRLNELEATTRVKLNFLDQIAKFWELQGSSLKIPNVERKALDLFTLYRVVLEEGGSDLVSRDRRWSRIATRMGYPPGRGVGSLLRQHYERILYPYHVFQEGTSITDLNLNEDSDGSDKQDRDYVPHGIPSRQAIKPPPDRYARRSKRRKDVENCTDDIDYSTNSELKKLQFYGAGPKMPGFHAQGSPGCDENKEALLRENHLECFKDVKLGQGARNLHMAFSGVRTEEAAKLGSLLKKKDRPKGKTPIEQIVCTLCKRGDEEASMLLCDGCDDSYHTFCLIPPLNEIPKGDWRCPCCVAKEVNKPQEAFGFEQAQREYTLQEFGNKADEFKNSYFGMPAHRVPYELLEKEFWRVVNAVDEDVTVEYGADLHTIEHGSGFPTSSSIDLKNKDVPYVNSGWNLNNLPVLEGSVLRHINADISGMKIPWTYVGMCFATFCWHNEDHWSYSINYLHWGEPKTWYGVPGGKAESFEEAMRSLAPELFNAQPDLLHQLVTIMNPNLLISQGVPICRTNQLAGEFVITFPRSYHAGFNQGYNFAEAVNFAPADWLPIGRVCVSHYGMLHRFCVFSHDELVCKMASNPDTLDVSIAASTYQDMLKMVEAEKEQRKRLLDWGVTQANREVFELLPDDARQCEYCKTTCFLSAVACSCQENKLVCIDHRNKLCLCPPEKHWLLYRYTLDELPNMLYRLKVRAESFDTWSAKLQDALSSKLSLVDLKQLVQESEEKHFPQNDLLQTATAIIEEAEKCTALAQQLLSRRVRTRTRHSGETRSSARLTLEDLQLFHHQLSTLSCEVKETFLVKDLLDRAIAFENTARDILEEDNIDPKKLEKCLETGLNLDIDIAEIPQLRQRLQQSHWLEEVKGSLSSDVTLEVLRHLLDKGVSVPPHPTVEKVLAELQELLTFGEKWEEKAKQCLSAKPKHPLSLLETVVREAGNISVKLPNVQQLMETVSMSKEWLNRVQTIQNGTHNPYLEVLEYLVSKGRPIHARLEPLPTIENQVEAAKAWRDKTARTFLKKNTHYTLLEVLSPRKDIGIQGLPKGKKKRKELDENSNDSLSIDIKFEDTKDPATIVASFKEAERRELEAMLLFRHKNERKYIEDNPEARFCICLKASSNNMVRCDLCKDWFHTSCVLSGNSKRDVKFLCPLCLRSRRPRLETILSLLVSLQKLPVRLPEGEALQCLTERGMSWQDRAKQSLKSEEVASALNTLHRITQQKSELAYSEKSEQITSSELRKADILNRWRSLSMSQPESPNENVPAPEIPTVPTDVDMVDLTADASLNADTETSGSYSSEHAYSTASKTLTTSTSSAVTPRKHARKSPLVARQTEPPVLHLSEGARAHLEQLMVEGDLLEITLDESRDITKLLRATRSQREASPSFSDIEDNPKPERKKIKKPKIDKPKGTFLKSKLTKSKNKLKQFQNLQDKPKKKKKKLQLSQLLSGDIKHKKGPKDVIKKGPREKKGPKGTLRENEPDDLCSAGSCLRPIGEAVDWVQCDGGCELWFHLLCVGLDVTQVSENEDYICPHCRSQNAPLDEMAASVLASFAQRTLQDTPSIRE